MSGRNQNHLSLVASSYPPAGAVPNVTGPTAVGIAPESLPDPVTVIYTSTNCDDFLQAMMNGRQSPVGAAPRWLSAAACSKGSKSGV